jgi:hypothetical protein
VAEAAEVGEDLDRHTALLDQSTRGVHRIVMASIADDSQRSLPPSTRRQ